MCRPIPFPAKAKSIPPASTTTYAAEYYHSPKRGRPIGAPVFMTPRAYPWHCLLGSGLSQKGHDHDKTQHQSPRPPQRGATRIDLERADLALAHSVNKTEIAHRTVVGARPRQGHAQNPRHRRLGPARVGRPMQARILAHRAEALPMPMTEPDHPGGQARGDHVEQIVKPRRRPAKAFVLGGAIA